MANGNELGSNLNQRLREIAFKMSEIEEKEIKTDGDLLAYKSLVAEGKKIRGQLDTLQEGDALKAWMNSPNGQSAVKHGWSQELTSPEDRDQEQRARDIAHKSAYKSVFEAYMRYGDGGVKMHLTTNDLKILGQGAIKAVTEATETNGGFTVPEDFQAEVLKKEPGLLGLNDVVRHQPTTRDVVVWPRLNYTADNKYTASHRLVWTGETPASATVHRVTDETFGQIRIPINVAMASQAISNSLVEDSITNVMELTAMLFRENVMQDVEFYLAQGTGAGQPQGITVNATAQANYVAALSGTTITADGLKDLYWKTPAQYRKNAKFVMNSDTARIISELKDGQNNYIWRDLDQFGGGGLAATQYDGVMIAQPRLLGAPVVFSEQMPSVAANGFPISFGDHRGYIVGDRVGMTVRVLDQLYAETDQLLYLLRLRLGGQLAEDYKIKLLKIAAS